MQNAIATARRALFAECRARGIDDDTRHQLIRDVGGIKSGSASDLTVPAARRVLDHLKKTAPRATPRPPGEWDFIVRAPELNRPLLRKIAAVCGALNIRRGGQKRYAEGVAKRQHGIDRHLEMMSASELWMVVGALERTRQYKGIPGAEGRHD